MIKTTNIMAHIIMFVSGIVPSDVGGSGSGGVGLSTGGWGSGWTGCRSPRMEAAGLFELLFNSTV